MSHEICPQVADNLILGITGSQAKVAREMASMASMHLTTAMVNGGNAGFTGEDEQEEVLGVQLGEGGADFPTCRFG
jgi:hypothetical protein